MIRLPLSYSGSLVSLFLVSVISSDRLSEGLDRDLSKAVECFTQATTMRHHPHGYYQLGLCYEEGCYFPKDKDKAKAYYQQGAQLKDADAQCRLALMKLENLADASLNESQKNSNNNNTSQKGVDKNISREITSLLHKAAAANHPRANYMLGQLHERGEGGALTINNKLIPIQLNISKSINEAMKRYEIAADQGYQPAIIRLAELLLEQRGLNTTVKAREWIDQITDANIQHQLRTLLANRG